jgi:serine/threonine protein kinase
MNEALVEEFLISFDDSRFPNDFLQHYEPMECLAYNTIGETLLVKDRQSGHYYVAKCYAEKSLLSQTTESDLLKKLHHTGLPAFVDEYENEVMLCVIREFAQGLPLDKLAKQNRFNMQQAISITIQLCDILSHLHEQTPPIIHRDIKPQNIIIDEQGKITLIDFGISRIYDETAQEDTISFGTKNFAAPEQYGFSQTDCRSDIFSLGVLLCWLLTGQAATNQAVEQIPNKQLAGIVKKCTAFAPKDRYKNVARVRDALTGRNIKKRVLAFLCTAVLLVTSFFLLSTFNGKPLLENTSGITFKEPLIEQAVRLSLNKNNGEELLKEDLLTVTELFVFGDKAAANEETYNSYSDSFVFNDGTVFRGSISSLEDIVKLKNIRRLSLAYQNITDLTPLSQLTSLESVEFKHNPIQDVSPLSQLASISSLGLFDTNVSDLTSLHSCPRLTNIDVGYTQVTSMTALDGLDSLQFLAMRKSPLNSLDHVDTHPYLEKLYLSETHLLDLSPLLDLPRLQLLEVSENMQPAAKAIEKQAQFEIIYQ